MEIWKDYVFDGRNYKVSNLGNIKGKKGLLTPRLDKDGYLIITLGCNKKRKSVKIHRIVAQLFIPNPNGYNEVNHKDFNRSNPMADNLEWIKHNENINYSMKNKRYKNKGVGSNNPNAKLSEEDVLNIRKLHDDGKNIAEIAKLYNRGWQTINHIIKRTTWNNI